MKVRYLVEMLKHPKELLRRARVAKGMTPERQKDLRKRANSRTERMVDLVYHSSPKAKRILGRLQNTSVKKRFEAKKKS